jgi:hypothetical protein
MNHCPRERKCILLDSKMKGEYLVSHQMYEIDHLMVLYNSRKFHALL